MRERIRKSKSHSQSAASPSTSWFGFFCSGCLSQNKSSETRFPKSIHPRTCQLNFIIFICKEQIDGFVGELTLGKRGFKTLVLK